MYKQQFKTHSILLTFNTLLQMYVVFLIYLLYPEYQLLSLFLVIITFILPFMVLHNIEEMYKAYHTEFN